MRIAYVITRSDEIGGAHIHVRDLASAFQSDGHEVRVFVGGEGPFLDALEKARVPYTSLKYLKREISLYSDIRALKELKACLRDYRPGLISLHSAKAGLLGRVVSRNLGVPVIFTAHGWSFAEGVPNPAKSIYLWLERLAAPFAERIITVCEADRDYAINCNVGNPRQIIAIHNGMPDVAERYLANPVNETPRIVMIARFEAQKDHVTLLRALSQLQGLDWRLSLVGDGPLVRAHKDMVGKLGLDERVEFLGRRRDIPEILAQGDIFVLASFWEGFPRSILEAMRAGLPVIASRVAGVQESVLDGDTGFLVEPGNIDQLRMRLDALIRSPSLRKKLGDKGRQRYETSFTFEQMANKTECVYHSIAKALDSDIPMRKGH